MLHLTVFRCDTFVLLLALFLLLCMSLLPTPPSLLSMAPLRVPLHLPFRLRFLCISSSGWGFSPPSCGSAVPRPPSPPHLSLFFLCIFLSSLFFPFMFSSFFFLCVVIAWYRLVYAVLRFSCMSLLVFFLRFFLSFPPRLLLHDSHHQCFLVFWFILL